MTACRVSRAFKDKKATSVLNDAWLKAVTIGTYIMKKLLICGESC